MYPLRLPTPATLSLSSRRKERVEESEEAEHATPGHWSYLQLGKFRTTVRL